MLHMCAIGSLTSTMQQTFGLYICDEVFYLESYETSCCIVSRNLIIITSNIAFFRNGNDNIT
jgi:hypothetical protein